MFPIGWRVVLLFLFLVLSLAESSSRPWSTWPSNLGAEQTFLYSWTIFSASICVLVALFLSTYLIFEHLAAYNQPEEQKFLIGIVLMVPVYALESFLSLLDADAAFNYEIIRDWYEAFALYCFGRYLIACLGGEDSTIEFMESKSIISYSIPLIEESYAYGIVEHPFPLSCLLKEWYLGPDFYQAVKIGIVQYVWTSVYVNIFLIAHFLIVISSSDQSCLIPDDTEAYLCTISNVFSVSWCLWGREVRAGICVRYFYISLNFYLQLIFYPYLAVVLNFSQSWALYCLVQFYSVTKDKLAPIKPLAKFLTFKSIVFLTWWQGVAVAFLFSMGAFKGSLAQELKTPVPYKRGERCVRDVSVMSDYASLGAPADPEEVRDSERTPKLRLGCHDERPKRPKLHQSFRDVVIGSGEIIVDDMKFTVSHVVEPVERGIAKINRTFHEISENVKRHEERRRGPKDDSYLIPLNPWTNEFSLVHEDIEKGSLSDSNLSNGRRQRQDNLIFLIDSHCTSTLRILASRYRNRSNTGYMVAADYRGSTTNH
ncbi:Organic solute transporter Ost-alpha [Cynara cardunculus var. scolymus]|uniref:Organic solute transporter Ost-alpha n=1 Tax=Cynara cardunculus var. scolymus TaxID=59895 RepID=A0A103XXH1_CYNCS|nr:Organic solute transporter Ost-alpha [Cynara cardunculus var. scolymus]